MGQNVLFWDVDLWIGQRRGGVEATPCSSKGLIEVIKASRTDVGVKSLLEGKAPLCHNKRG